MDKLIKVVKYKDSRAVNARELHAALNVKRDFSNWIKDRIKKHAFEEGADYSPHAADRSDGSPGNRVPLSSFPVCGKGVVRGGAQRHRPRYLLKAEEAWNTPE
ncbi:MAG: antA/AntB antirepressor family protein, partial [Treponema sp.]|nr:antA/AntB antirepressor family protein [Treponema sp.]